MSTAITKLDGAYGSFREAVADALVGKEGYLVELVTADTVQLVATVGKEFGVIDFTDKTTGDVRVRFLNAPGIAKFVQGAAIAGGAKIKAAVGGKVVTAASVGDRTLGIKHAPFTNGANGDVISAITIVDKIIA